MSARSEFPEYAIVGIDDTDMPDEGGTGRLARDLAESLEHRDVGRTVGVTRHQLFEGAGVPKTSRNSSAALSVVTDLSRSDLLEVVASFVADRSIPGSDPGVAIANGPVPDAVVLFARRAQRGLVTQQEARKQASDGGLALRGLGGDEGGVIGATCAVALRSDGNDGRFVGLPGIRDVSGALSVGEVLERTAIWKVVDVDQEEALPSGVIIDLGTWIRPRLIGGRPVVVARHQEGKWVNADARHT